MTNKFELMPISLSSKLDGLTVNAAIEQGLITQVGDEYGNFIFQAEGLEGVYYAIINSYLIACSESVTKLQDIASYAGGLVFYKYIVAGEAHYRLGLPNNVKVGHVVANLKGQ